MMSLVCHQSRQATWFELILDLRFGVSTLGQAHVALRSKPVEWVYAYY